MHRNLEAAKNYLMQYQIIEQRIAGLNLIDQSDYTRKEIETGRSIQEGIEETIRKMPLSQKKTVIELHYIGGMTLEKIGRKLLIAETTVKKYHKLGLERIFEILKEAGQI